jgi:hypothetical protein
MRQIIPYGIGKVNTDTICGIDFLQPIGIIIQRALYPPPLRERFYGALDKTCGGRKLFALLCVSIWYYDFTTNGEGETPD